MVAEESNYTSVATSRLSAGLRLCLATGSRAGGSNVVSLVVIVSFLRSTSGSSRFLLLVFASALLGFILLSRSGSTTSFLVLNLLHRGFLTAVSILGPSFGGPLDGTVLGEPLAWKAPRALGGALSRFVVTLILGFELNKRLDPGVSKAPIVSEGAQTSERTQSFQERVSFPFIRTQWIHFRGRDLCIEPVNLMASFHGLLD
jgi:hypothetical protein